MSTRAANRRLFIALFAGFQVAALWLLPLLAGGPVWAEALASALLAAIHALVAMGLGLLLFRLVHSPLRSELGEGGTACFLGVGALGLITLLLGLVGLCSVAPLRLLMTFLAMALSPVLGPRMAGFFRQAKLHRVELVATGAAAVLGGLLLLQAATPPLTFDALEYHLAVPRLWLRAGHIFPVPGNFFSHQPFCGELNFLIDLALGRDLLPTIPKWFNLAGLVASLGLVLALGRSLGLWRGVRIAAVILVAATPLIFKISTDALVDIWVVCGVLAAVKTWQRWLASRHPGALMIAALSLGILMTFKQSATAIWVLPLLGLFLWTMISHRLIPPEWIISLAMLLVCAALPVAPWWIKEWWWTGNPVFPFGFGLLDGAGWSEAQSHLLVGGHGLRSPLAGAFWVDLFTRMAALGPFTLSLLAGALVFAWRRHARGLVGSTLGAVVAAILIWNLLQHSADRFLAPAPALLVPLGLGGLQQIIVLARARWGRAGVRWVMAVALVPIGEMLWWLGLAPQLSLSLFLIAAVVLLVLPLAMERARSTTLAHAAALLLGLILATTILLGDLSDGGTLGRFLYLVGSRSRGDITQGLPHLDAFRFLNEIEHPSGSVLLVYESRTFNLDAPAVMGTVFDGQPLRRFVAGAASLDEVFARLRGAGVTDVVVNFFEMNRLMATYFGGLPEEGLPDARPFWDFPAPLSDSDWELVEDFQRWALNHAIYNWRRANWVIVARVPQAAATPES